MSRVAHVQVSPDQIKFSGTIAEAFEAAEDGVGFHGIFLDRGAVGFFKIDRAYSDRYPLVPFGALGLRAFMVDLDRQGQGIAARAVQALPAYLARHYPLATAHYLTVNKINPCAIRAYLKGGFIDTGEKWPLGNAGPQHVMRMSLNPPKRSSQHHPSSEAC
ncbi:GNAT family N-acetyltransferase [Sulfitobacter sp. JBTF-M27]|uniref:GNAT family N-acetyltransferase n=1 Tax=Sulfitobacter sediminilitoris TaxID=2698830 RepID=A0A6P0CF73_9RHOB|nr:GNAT family N-acetyltransferase [Sulfitobacter sediminilitoris]